ncbi:MAG: dTDP-4-dehydrorhamnose 3,5-epimerase [Polyangiales bacterium]
MRFEATPIEGVWVVEPERREDPRGYFARTWCAEEFRARGLRDALSQCSVSFNAKAGTLRGMHYQTAPEEEAKLVSCPRGRIWDVALDLRRGSPTYCQWYGAELSAENGRALYVPPGCAHGMVTLEDDALVSYFISTPYSPAHQAAVRWDDPAFGIAWPVASPTMSDRDRALPDFVP